MKEILLRRVTVRLHLRVCLQARSKTYIREGYILCFIDFRMYRIPNVI